MPSERAVRLDHQWHGRKIAAVGLQETRRPQGKVLSDHYIGFASGAQVCGKALHFGCELWLHKTLPLDPAGTLTFRDFQATVVVADPRRLVVNLAHKDLYLSFVVLHVPCKTAQFDLDALREWWSETVSLLRRAQLASLTWCMLDANAPLAAKPSDFFQMCSAEPTNAQGALLEDALQELEWLVASTMEPYQVEPHTTWLHPKGRRFRRDYIVASRAAHSLTDATWVEGCHDGGFSHEEHLPVALRCRGWISGRSKTSAIQWDTLAFLDPERC